MDGAPPIDEATGPRGPTRGRVPRVVLVLGAIALVLALLVVGVALGAERFVNGKKDTALADLSAQLGRPVTAGRIRLALLRGRVEVRDIVVGRDPARPEEPDPAFKLDRFYVAVSLGSALRSLGKQVAVQEILFERPLVQVSRDKDGVLNWQRLADRLPKSEPRPPEPMDPATREKVNGAHVRSFRVDDARLRFVDLARGGATAEIADLDVEVPDVSVGRAFQARISAAVLAAAKNFDLRASFVPGPPTADGIPAPSPEKLTVKLEPTPLAPLAPFVGALLGGGGLEELTEGKLSIDLTAVPGAAAPGGKGETTVRGLLALAGLKFAGGETFDARLESDVGGDLAKGALDVKQLRAQLGVMGVRMQARLADLQGTPRVETFTVQSEGLDFTRLRAYYPPLDRVSGAELRGPFTVEAQGQGNAEEQKLTARLDLTPASVSVPGQLRKPAGTPLSVELRATAGKELVRVERMALTLAKVVMTAAATLRTHGTGRGARQTFEASLDAPTFAVREVGALVAPKETAGLPDIKVALKAKASATVGQPESIRAEVSDLKVASGKSDLTGRLNVQNLNKPRISFQGRSKYLDPDDFVPAEAKGSGKADARATASKAGGKPAEPLPPMVRDLEGTVDLAVERGRAGGIDYRDLRTQVTIKEGRLLARTLEMGAFGGRFSGAGSQFPLPGIEEPFQAKGQVEGLDLAQAIAHLAPRGSGILTGKLSGKLDLTGNAIDPKAILDTLTGLLSGRLADAEFLPASLLEPVVQAIETAGRGTAVLAGFQKATAARTALLRDRRLRDLAGGLRFAEGALEIATPLKAQTPSGPLSLEGRVGLDGEAALRGELALSPEAASALLGGKARFDAPVPVQLRIEGPLRKPRIRPAEPAQLAKVFLTALARSEAGEAVKAKAAAVTEQATAQAREQATKATEAAEQARKAAEERARQEAEKAREAAGRRLRGILGR
jgi:uncharacterized protein involved in outer membrane biogenesis